MSSLVLLLFYFFGAVAIVLGLTSLRGGLRFALYLRTELTREFPVFTPLVTVFVPCRGLDDGLKENLSAIFSQDYPSFETVFVSDRADDPALAVAQNLSDTLNSHSSRIVVAGPATDTGQKVHNLRAAVATAVRRSEVFVFVDTDARPHSSWLRSLVAPLQDKRIGAATGYRWFVPRRGNFAGHLRSVWNASIASALGELEDKNFCWGGSTAIRRETYEDLKIDEHWRGTVSDDFALTRALHTAGLPIKFVPQCLTPSVEDCGLRELFEFTTRQLKITRAYAAHLWKAVLFGSAIFSLVFFGGIGLEGLRAARGLSGTIPHALLLVIFALGALKAYLRLRAVRLFIKDRRVLSMGTTVAHLTLWPVASLLFLCNALAAAVSRRITWRGISYELKSPNETVIIRRDK